MFVAPVETRRSFCSCTPTTVPSPAGEMLVLRAAGEIDTFTSDVLQTALARIVEQRPIHVVLDLAGLTFCSARGMSMIVGSATIFRSHGIGYGVSGVSAHIARILNAMWPADELPDCYPTAALGVLAAATHRPVLRGDAPGRHPAASIPSLATQQ